MQKNSYFFIFFENFRVILHTNAYYFFNFRALAKKKVASDLLRFGSQFIWSRFFVSWPETCGTQSNRWPGKKHKNALFSRTARATFTSKHLAKHTRCDSCKSGLHFVWELFMREFYNQTCSFGHFVGLRPHGGEIHNSVCNKCAPFHGLSNPQKNSGIGRPHPIE